MLQFPNIYSAFGAGDNRQLACLALDKRGDIQQMTDISATRVQISRYQPYSLSLVYF